MRLADAGKQIRADKMPEGSRKGPSVAVLVFDKEGLWEEEKWVVH